jgi:hypothetical protein
MLGQSADLLVLRLEHLLHQKHLSLLFDQFPSVFPILGPLNWNGEAGCLCHIHLALHLGVDC